MTGTTPQQTPTAGWYYAAGDPPGTMRYWNGNQWQGQPKQVGPAAVGLDAPPTAAAAPAQGAVATPSSVTTTAPVETSEEAAAQPTTRKKPMPDDLQKLATRTSVVRLLLIGLAMLFIYWVRSAVNDAFSQQPTAADAGLQSLVNSALIAVLLVIAFGAAVNIVQLVMARTRNVVGLMLVSGFIAVVDVVNVVYILRSFTLLSLPALVVAGAFCWSEIQIALRCNGVRRTREVLRTSTVTGRTVVREQNHALADLEAKLEDELEKAPELLNADGSFNMEGLGQSGNRAA